MEIAVSPKSERLLPELPHFLSARFFFSHHFQHLLIALAVPIVDSERQMTGTA